MRYGYNSYGESAWTPIKKLKKIELERDNQWFNDKNLNLNKTFGIWVTEKAEDALFYIFSPTFRDLVHVHGLILPKDFEEEYEGQEKEYEEFIDALIKPLEYVYKIDLKGAIPAIKHSEEFAHSFLYIKPVTK